MIISRRRSPGIEMSRDARIRLAVRQAVAVDMGGLQGLPGLKRKRTQMYPTQKAFAEACGVDRQTYNRWENGTYWPSAKMLPIIASALGCTIEDLFLPDEESEGY